MSDEQRETNFAAGPKPPEVPSVPIPGQAKPEGKSNVYGRLLGSIKVAGAVVGILATLAGIGFGVEQLVQSNR
jgi:hypothetical protein